MQPRPTEEPSTQPAWQSAALLAARLAKTKGTAKAVMAGELNFRTAEMKSALCCCAKIKTVFACVETQILTQKADVIKAKVPRC